MSCPNFALCPYFSTVEKLLRRCQEIVKEVSMMCQGIIKELLMMCQGIVEEFTYHNKYQALASVEVAELYMFCRWVGGWPI